MNLQNIVIAPHAEGFIKVACEVDPLFFDQSRTRNEFLITARHHTGAQPESVETAPPLAEHPIRTKLAKQPEGRESAQLQEIPIKLFFNKADKAIKINYQAFDATDKVRAPVCSGNGRDATRLMFGEDGAPTQQQVACAGPERCEFVASGKAICRRQVRMSVQIDGQDNPFSVFEVRTSSINSYRALRAQLGVIEKRFGGLRHVPLKLTLWQASNEVSGYQPFTLMQLALNAKDEVEAMQATKAARDQLQAAGLDDDVDAALDAMDSAHEFGLPTLEYQGVSEFYADPVSRRPGTQGAAPARRSIRSGAAADVIGHALHLSGRAASATEGGGSPLLPDASE